MKYIEKIKLFNFKRFQKFEYDVLQNRNLLVGDNEAGKSSILDAVDIVFTGNRQRLETHGIESIFNRDAISTFLSGTRSFESLPQLTVEIYLNDFGAMDLEGLNNSEGRICHGLKLNICPMPEYVDQINQVLGEKDSPFPFEYYAVRFVTFAEKIYTQNRRYINHLLIDSSLIGTDYATRQYTRSLYEASTEVSQRYGNSFSYRQSKSEFVRENLDELNKSLKGTKFDVKNDSKSSLDHDLVITRAGIPVSDLGKGAQCFIKTDFALEKKEGKNPIDVVLIEEPENHLSHLNMKKLIDRIENATQTQLLIATHSNIVCSRLDLHNAFMLGKQSEKPTSLKALDGKTANYFIKAPNTKILEFILSERVLLVEGDSEYMLVDSMYEKLVEKKPENDGVHIISVGGTSFPRYLDLAKLLGIKTAVICDNDGDILGNCIKRYKDYGDDNIKVFYDEDEVDRTTLEKCLYGDNMKLCDDLFEGRPKTNTILEYMLSKKTDVALEIVTKHSEDLVAPSYINEAIAWIRK